MMTPLVRQQSPCEKYLEKKGNDYRAWRLLDRIPHHVHLVMVGAEDEIDEPAAG